MSNRLDVIAFTCQLRASPNILEDNRFSVWDPVTYLDGLPNACALHRISAREGREQQIRCPIHRLRAVLVLNNELVLYFTIGIPTERDSRIPTQVLRFGEEQAQEQTCHLSEVLRGEISIGEE